ncbi:MAG: hypothetical protein J6E29_06890 [Prevotella sp.]|nr:hypothetical protein [Prevotella sp.]
MSTAVLKGLRDYLCGTLSTDDMMWLVGEMRDYVRNMGVSESYANEELHNRVAKPERRLAEELSFTETKRKKIVRIISVKPSPYFGMEIDGNVNRVLKVMWSAEEAEEDLRVQFLNYDKPYPGNLILPNSFTFEQLEAFKSMVQKQLDEGTLSVYGYEFPVFVVSEGKAKAYINTAKPENALMETIRRAWPRDNEENVVLSIIRAQVEKAIKMGKIKPVTT